MVGPEGHPAGAGSRDAVGRSGYTLDKSRDIRPWGGQNKSGQRYKSVKVASRLASHGTVGPSRATAKAR